MLVLTRKRNQSIQIGDCIFLKVLGVTKGQVRLGIEAPDGVTIWRTELLDGESKPPISRIEVIP